MKAVSNLCLSLLAAALCLPGCSRSEPAATPSWTPEQVATLHLQLVDPELVQDISFATDGNATAAIGDQSGVTPVIVYWKISGGRLTLSTADSLIDELSIVSETDEHIVARSKSGKVLKYRKLGR